MMRLVGIVSAVSGIAIAFAVLPGAAGEARAESHGICGGDLALDARVACLKKQDAQVQMFFFSESPKNRKWPKGSFKVNGHRVQVEYATGTHFQVNECFTITEAFPDSQKYYWVASVPCEPTHGPNPVEPNPNIVHGFWLAIQSQDDSEEYDLGSVLFTSDDHTQPAGHDIEMTVLDRDSKEVPNNVWFQFVRHTDDGSGGVHGGAAHSR